MVTNQGGRGVITISLPLETSVCMQVIDKVAIHPDAPYTHDPLLPSRELDKDYNGKQK